MSSEGGGGWSEMASGFASAYGGGGGGGGTTGSTGKTQTAAYGDVSGPSFGNFSLGGGQVNQGLVWAGVAAVAVVGFVIVFALRK